MSYLPPPIEVFSSQGDRETPPDATRRAPRRLVVFLSVFLPSLLLGLGYVWLREPLYESRATLLTVAPIVIDQPGAGHGDHQVIIQNDRGATTQQTEHVVIQKQTLLGAGLVEDILIRLHANDDAEDLTVADLQGMLTVTPFPDTNVVELRAEGSNDRLLPAVVNAWIDAYQAMRTKESASTEETTANALREETLRLDNKIANKRQELDLFRRTHDILTKEEADNQAMARLRGLNESLNKASDEEVKAKARIDAARAAIARGEPVVPPEEQASLSYLEQRAQVLREKLAELRRRYTASYINLQPQLKVIPEQLRQIEKEIAQKVAQGQRDEVAAAQQAYLAARQTVLAIRGQMQDHKRDVAEFTTRFSQHTAMEKELSDMEDLYRRTQEQLLHMEVAPRDRLPQLSVVDRASPPGAPIWPDYRRDSGIAFGVSLALALFTLWLYEYLTARPPVPARSELPIPNIQVYAVPENVLLARQNPPPASLPEESRATLEHLPPRELSEVDIQVLMDAAPVKARQLIGTLLCGLSLEEAASLRDTDIDLDYRQIRASGQTARSLPMPPVLHALFADQRPLPAWGVCDSEQLAALIACTAVDSGLPAPDQITPDALRHSYIVYLVRQGIRLSELEQVVGPLPAKVLTGYARLSPVGAGLPLDTIDLTYPVLRIPVTPKETS